MMNQEQDFQSPIDIVSVLSDIIRKFERYNSAVETKNSDSQEVAQKILELQKRLNEAREYINTIQGIDQSKQQQLEHLENLKTQLKAKQELIEKYRQFNF